MRGKAFHSYKSDFLTAVECFCPLYLFLSKPLIVLLRIKARLNNKWLYKCICEWEWKNDKFPWHAFSSLFSFNRAQCCAVITGMSVFLYFTL